MTLSPQQRWLVIGSALILTLGAMYQLDQQADDGPSDSLPELSTDHSPDMPVKRSEKTSGAPQAESIKANAGVLPDLANKDTSAVSDNGADLFRSHAWYVPPPPPKATATAFEKPVPVAPPVPFGYMGKLENTPQGTLIFLSANNKVVTVVAGQQVDTAWRLDKEDANALQFTYLPLDLPKTLSKSAKVAAPASANAAINPDGFANPAAPFNDEIPNN